MLPSKSTGKGLGGRQPAADRRYDTRVTNWISLTLWWHSLYREWFPTVHWLVHHSMWTLMQSENSFRWNLIRCDEVTNYNSSQKVFIAKGSCMCALLLRSLPVIGFRRFLFAIRYSALVSEQLEQLTACQPTQHSNRSLFLSFRTRNTSQTHLIHVWKLQKKYC